MKTDELKPRSHLRGTGRTTRMLKYAIEQAKDGKCVVIYASTAQQLDFLEDRLYSILNYAEDVHIDKKYTCTSFVAINSDNNRGNIRFERIDRTFDWHKTLKNAEAWHSNLSLVDHYAIEQAFPAITEMLYRFIGPVNCEDCDMYQSCPGPNLVPDDWDCPKIRSAYYKELI